MESQVGDDAVPLCRGADRGPEDSVSTDADRGSLTGADDSFGFSADVAWSLSGELPAGANLGGVTILRLLAEGGMGRVYEARQEAPRRTVAVKVIREGVVSRHAAERFLREAETLAALRHPHIAQIHTCGTAPQAYGGVPFFVMELVDDARPITRFAAARSLSIRARVALFRHVCEAVAHGHRRGVIHRDLKPANILVDGNGEPKLIDFGIARGGEAASTPADAGSVCPAGRAVASGADGLVGTLRYMSPEQVLAPLESAAESPDARSDVYALGLVLHELVTGRLPYDLAGKSFAEATRVLASTAAPGTAMVERAVSLEERRDDARALAVIVAKCLEPQVSDRYATAGEVAADLGRWLDGRAILARPPTSLESMRRVARRHRVAVTAVVVSATALAGAVVAVSLLSMRLAGQRREAEAARGVAAAEAEAAGRQLFASTVLLAAAARDRDSLADAANLLDEAHRLAAATGAGRPIELACLAASLDDSRVAMPQSQGTVTAVAWSPDGRSLATGDSLGVLRICDSVASAAAPPRTVGSHKSGIWSVAVSPDGRLVAAATGDGTVSLYDMATGRLERELEGWRQTVYATAFSADGRRLATASRDKTARLWDVSTGKESHTLRGHEGTVYGVAWSRDGDIVATASHDTTVRVWDAATGRCLHTLCGHSDRVFDVAIASDGECVASASKDGTVRIWDLGSGEETLCLRHPTRVNAVAFDTEGKRVATVSADGQLRIWDVGRGVEIGRLRGHTSAAWSVDWARGDGLLATGGADGTVRVWDPTGRPDVIKTGGRVLAVAHAPDGAIMATGMDDAEVRLWDATTLTECGRLGPALGRVNGVAWSPDAALLAAACDDGAIFVWDVASRERLVAAQAHSRRVYAVAFSPDGRQLASASEDRTVGVRDPRTGAVVGPRLVHPRRVFSAAYTPDGRRIATGCEDRLVRLWDAVTGEEQTRLEGHDGPVNWIAFSPDGARLASASSDGTVRLWRMGPGAEEHVLTGPAAQVWKVAFSPDGSRVAAAGADGAVHVWNTSTGRSALALNGHRDQVWGLAFGPDGGSIVTGAWDGTVRVWGLHVADIIRRRTAVAR